NHPWYARPIGIHASPSPRSTCHYSRLPWRSPFGPAPLFARRSRRAQSWHLDLASTIPHERILDDANRYELAANVDLRRVARAGRHTRERDRLGQRRRKRAGKDLTVAVRRDDALAMAQNALVVHDQSDHDALDAFGLLFFERGAANEVAAFVQRNGPGQSGFPRRNRFVHVLAVQVHPGFEAQCIARAETGWRDTGTDQAVPQVHG